MPIHQTAKTFGARRVPTASAASGCWQLGEVTQARRDGIWPKTGDPYFDSVQLLLPMDGTNGSTTFTDASSNSLTVTANGNAAISTSESKFGGASAYFDGTGDHLAVDGQTELALGTSDFTIEMWIYPEAFSTGKVLIDTRVTAGDTGYVLLVNVSSKLVLVSSGGARVTSASSVSLNQWTHVAVSREAGTLRAFLDGQLDASATYASAMTSPRSLPVIGIQTFGDAGWQGYIDDFRITKGTNGARYTAAFTPPAIPHTTS